MNRDVERVPVGMLKWAGAFAGASMAVFVVLMLIGAGLWFITWTVPHPHWWGLIRISLLIGFILSLLWLAGSD